MCVLYERGWVGYASAGCDAGTYVCAHVHVIAGFGLPRHGSVVILDLHNELPVQTPVQ